MKTPAFGSMFALALAVALNVASGTAHAQGRPVGCTGPNDTLQQPTTPGATDLSIQGKLDGNGNVVEKKVCTVTAGTYKWRHVNILKGAELKFDDADIHFWARGILVEDGGTLTVGTAAAPIGAKGVVTFHLWGADANKSGTLPDAKNVGITCLSTTTASPCGIPDAFWNSNIHAGMDMMAPVADAKRISSLPGAASYPPKRFDDYFYAYDPLAYDNGEETLTKRVGYFGHKVIGVSYGGTLQMYGKKGVAAGNVDESSGGNTWVRLNQSIGGDNVGEKCDAGSCTLALERAVDWVKGDQIVVTTTDYLPGHSEQLEIIDVDQATKTLVTVKQKIQWRHSGSAYDISNVPSRLGLGASRKTVETRAVVGLLTRSIRIVSAGDTANDDFPAEPTWSATSPAGYFFGGQVIARQGFKTFEMSGVELYQLGQGGKIGHYPVHFHHARRTTEGTFVRDTSIHDSNTRWIVLHGTQDLTLQRNVGYKSIGHGFYLEDGTEINNKLIGNVGVFARAAIDNEQNPRKIPGILAAKQAKAWDPNPNLLVDEAVPFYSDFDHPAVFWIMNAWNEFAYNVASGAGSCGVCYWVLPGATSGMSRHMAWDGYASLQTDATMKDPTARAGLTPLKRFVGNQCSTAQVSFNVVANTTACYGIAPPGAVITDGMKPVVKAIENPLAPDACKQSNQLLPDGSGLVPWACMYPNADNPTPAHVKANEYYPQIGGGGRFPTKCASENGDCSGTTQCSGANLAACMLTVIDNYTSSFHWAETNFAAIWLRKDWYLVQNSALTDVINGGLTFVTGGGYTDADVIPGHWALLYKSVFVGETQSNNPLASIASPVNNQAGALKCETGGGQGNHCLISKEGVSFPKGNFGVNQRMFNIYDGPAYQDSNAYLNIKTTTLDCAPGVSEGANSNCGSSKFLQGPITGVPRDGTRCYLPHAAIGWKQPNGFYYPPAFHSDNLFFDAVDIRHYVIQPLFVDGSYKTNAKASWEQYCNFTSDMFINWTDIDRQTELNDDDGSLTGYQNTISVNKDPFFTAPREATECASDDTVNTSPYDYVSTVLYPGCLLDGTCGNVHPAWDPNGLIPAWNKDCGSAFCYGVPLYRQLTTGTEKKSFPAYAPQIRMAGQGTGQRSTLSTNNGTYYIDTTVGVNAQSKDTPGALRVTSLNVFQELQTYYVALLFAKDNTKQTYQFYVGPGFDKTKDLWAVRAHVAADPPTYDRVDTPASWSVDVANGIATVTISMEGAKSKDGYSFKSQYLEAQHNGCQPSSFCTPSPATFTKGSETPSSCGCTGGTDPISKMCTQSVCAWAGNDPECPAGGCWGFAFKLPKGFQTDQPVDLTNLRACFDKKKGWDVKWVNAGSKNGVDNDPLGSDIAGKSPVCYKAPVFPDDFCPE